MEVRKGRRPGRPATRREMLPGQTWEGKVAPVRGRLIRVTHVEGGYVHYEVLRAADGAELVAGHLRARPSALLGYYELTGEPQ